MDIREKLSEKPQFILRKMSSTISVGLWKISLIIKEIVIEKA